MKHPLSNQFTLVSTHLRGIISDSSHVLHYPVSLFIIVLLSMSFTLSGCNGGDHEDKKEPFKLKIGLVLPKTGSLETFGGPTRNGASLAVEHLTKAGYEVTTIEVDDQSNPEAGIAVTQQLINQEKIPVLVGAVSS
ncbi:MAG: hypothetical protein BWK79_11285, partial [Beggiatoa sp. IS2]